MNKETKEIIELADLISKKEKKSDVKILFTLNTLAKEEYRSSPSYTHTDRRVHIIIDPTYGDRPILKIENTPGSWFMHTLLETYGKENSPEQLPIHGMTQMCMNANTLVIEALQKLKEMNIDV